MFIVMVISVSLCALRSLSHITGVSTVSPGKDNKQYRLLMRKFTGPH